VSISFTRQPEAIKSLLYKKATEYDHINFITNDPICVPHAYKKLQDIEIAGLFAAIFAWGNRATIINKAKQLLQLMDNDPYVFIKEHKEQDLKPFLQFKHRTFLPDDILYLIHFLQQHYSKDNSLETAFAPTIYHYAHIEQALIHFNEQVFSLSTAPTRTRKHISTPARGSTCKRLCMYLRWMVRHNKTGVDFGLWKNIKPSQLIMPIDVHVARVAHKLGLINSPKNSWQQAVDLTGRLAIWEPNDPTWFDFALFNLGVEEKY
jgi:uncharacterized protein (TIGR02757 family)